MGMPFSSTHKICFLQPGSGMLHPDFMVAGGRSILAASKL
jgi:hypothetical protein